MASTARELKKMQAEVSCKMEKEGLEKARKGIFRNDGFKELALRDVMQNDLLTKEEHEIACRLSGKEIAEIAAIESYCPEPPVYMKLSSSLSGQEVTLKIPKLQDQLALRLVCYFLEPYVMSITSPLSFGEYSGNSIHDVFKKIEEIVYRDRPAYATTFKVDVCSPEDFKTAIEREVPLEEALVERLVEQGHISIRELYGGEEALSLFPTVSGLAQTAVILKALNNVYQAGSFIITSKDEFLVLSDESEPGVVNQLDRVLGNCGLGIDRAGMETSPVSGCFSYLGKTCYLSEGKLKFEQTGTVNDCVVEYFRSVTGTPLETSSQVNNEANRLVLLLNTYYRGIEIEDLLTTLKEVLVYNHFKNSIKGSPEEIESLIVSNRESRETLENVIGAGTPLYMLGDGGPYISSRQVKVKRHPKCMLCGRFFKRAEEAKEVVGLGDGNYVHERCYEEIYGSIKRLKTYFDFDFNRYLKNMDILRENSGNGRVRTKGIKSDWKYYPLYRFLCDQEEDEVTLSFRKIESILKSKLPPSLKSGREQWFNFSRNDLTIRSSWESAGFKMVFLDVPGKVVRFRKKKVGMHQIETLGLDKVEVPIEVKKTADRFFRQFISKHSLEL